MQAGDLEIAGGSIPGRDHLGRNEVLLGRNNQDAYLWDYSEGVLLAGLADGCGSEPHSEVGAKLGVRLLLRSLRICYRQFLAQAGQSVEISDPHAFLGEVRAEMLRQLRLYALQMTSAPAQFSRVLEEYFYFTLLGVFISSKQTLVFSLGDGIWALNGEIHRLGPFPDNRPPYLAYGLVSTSFSENPEALQLKLEAVVPTDTVQSLLIGTDGAADLLSLAERKIPGKEECLGPLSQFWEKDIYFTNPDGVRRRLSLANREAKRLNRQSGQLECETGLLRDDSTLVVLRRGTPSVGRFAPATSP